MSYSIFRVQGIKTLGDLRGISKHNVDRVSTTNKDIDHSKSDQNIEIVPCESYRQTFNRITLGMKAEHLEHQETVRLDRRKSFENALDGAKNDVACEFLFTSDEKFFEGKSIEDIRRWAERSMDFVHDDIGIERNNIIHASVHMDEKTPHLHVVAVPLIRAYDGRKKKETWQISRRRFIKGKEELVRLQDKYNERMNDAGYNLERGERGTGREHLTVEKFKAETLKKEIKQLDWQANNVKMEKKMLETDLDSVKTQINNARNDLKAFQGVNDYEVQKIDSRTKKTPLGVVISKQDYEDLRNNASKTNNFELENRRLEQENNNLRNKVGSLVKTNSEIRNENQDLKGKIEFLENVIDMLQDTIEIVKENSQKLLNIAREKIADTFGKTRSLAFLKVFNRENFTLSNLQKFIPNDELKGAVSYRNSLLETEEKRALEKKRGITGAIGRANEKVKSQEKPQRNDDWDMER